MTRIPISKRLRFQILERDGFACRYCGAAAPHTVLHVDHVLAVKSGGTNDPENLVTSCRDCNLGKGVLRVSDGIEDVQERAIAASMMLVATERFGASLPPNAFGDLLDFSLMSGPRPELIDIVASASSWEGALRALYRDAGFPERFWTTNDE